MDGLLYLEDGTVYRGKGFGFQSTSVGELVFNTSMTGYQEVLTDPSYMGQIINMTYPLIGNYGINADNSESRGIFAFGLIVKEICRAPSNTGVLMTVDEWLRENKVPGVMNVDTRRITRKIRSAGAMKCLISTEGIPVAEAKKRCDAAILRGDYMKRAGVKELTTRLHDDGEQHLQVAILDFGTKENILRSLFERGCDLYIFPYSAAAEEMMSINPDGIFLTNGPGDPEAAEEAIREVKTLIARANVPIFGICMGHQILALAMGGKTFKMKYGHRGGNHGVYDKDSDRSFITSQNHGYAVSPESILLKGMEVTHLNLNDGTVEGMKHRSMPVFSVQFHPEASPGPRDTAWLFDRFVRMMKGGNA